VFPAYPGCLGKEAVNGFCSKRESVGITGAGFLQARCHPKTSSKSLRETQSTDTNNGKSSLASSLLRVGRFSRVGGKNVFSMEKPG